jgi:hypothetical protein
MPVSFLRYNLACLLRVDAPVSLSVGPAWGALAHGGTITDRVFPGTAIPCPYVEPSSEVRVQVAALNLLASIISASVPLLDPGLLSSPAVEGVRAVQEVDLADMRRAIVAHQITVMNTSSVGGGLSPHELVYSVPLLVSDAAFSPGPAGQAPKEAIQEDTTNCARVVFFNASRGKLQH